MKRKTFILLTATLILLFSTVCFASDMGNNIKSKINGATNTIVDGTQNLAEDIRNGIGEAENTIENGARNIGNTEMDGTNDVMDMQDDNYTATRAIAEDVSIVNNTTVTTWTWIAVAIAAIVIVGLVWYYSAQYNDKH